MFKVILFDLDGTLLPLDMDDFVPRYFEAVAPHFSHLDEPKKFIKQLMKSTMDMINNTGCGTNEEVFMESFLPAIGQEKEIVYPLFDKFYAEEFPKLKKYAGYSELSTCIVNRLLEKNYRLVLATNPVFPRLATEHRMSWAGVDKYPWELVTTYEDCRSCKPNPAYYREISARLSVEPKDCLMVGNDAQEDLVAGTLGMKTYLVTDYLIDRGEPSYPFDFQGTLAELLEFVTELPSV